MTIRSSVILVITIIVIAFASGIYFYPQLPDPIASHFNTEGLANGFMPKLVGVFLIPFAILILTSLLYFFPMIDPLKENWKSFRAYYNSFIVIITAFLLYVYFLLLTWNLGYHLNIGRLFLPAFALLWFSIGIILPHTKRNWFVGIRTPWTVSNDKVWDKTHRLAGALFKISAPIILIGLVVPTVSFYFLIVPAVTSVLLLVIYSYVIYREQ